MTDIKIDVPIQEEDEIEYCDCGSRLINDEEKRTRMCRWCI